jgi:hypothetical protein
MKRERVLGKEFRILCDSNEVIIGVVVQKKLLSN